MKYFPDDFIGQETLKRAVSFKLDAYNESGVLRPTLITGSRGTGKTSLVYQIVKNLKTSAGSPKECIEIGCQSIKNLSDFISEVVDPLTQNDEEKTIFLEEVHYIPKTVMGFLLQAFNTTDNGITTAQFNGNTYNFDLRRTSWLMATTNKEKLVKPLLDRCINQFEMESYSISELGLILHKNTPGVLYTDDELIDNIARYGRNNPRRIFEISEHIKDFCLINKTSSIGAAEWDDICSQMGLQPFNLTHSEVLLLHILATDGASRVTHLASKLQLDLNTVRRETEHFLLANGLVRIDTLRQITPHGRKVLAKCDLGRIKNRALVK